jgi:hypothetical protein
MSEQTERSGVDEEEDAESGARSTHSSSKLNPASLTASSDGGGASGSGAPPRAAIVRCISVTPIPYFTPAMEHLKKSMRLQVSVPAGQKLKP